MSYSNFKNLEIIKQKFDLGIKSADSLFSDVEDINPSLLLTQLLQENVPLALNINTEKARSEFIIAPVLMEVRRLFKQQVSLFSGTDFSVDETQDLNGYCDFILSASRIRFSSKRRWCVWWKPKTKTSRPAIRNALPKWSPPELSMNSSGDRFAQFLA